MIATLKKKPGRRKSPLDHAIEMDEHTLNFVKAIQSEKEKTGAAFVPYSRMVQILRDLGWSPPDEAR